MSGNELPPGALVIFRDGNNDVQIGSNGEIDFGEAGLTLAVAQAKVELLAYRLAKQQFEAQQHGAGLIKPAPNLRVPKV